MGGTALVRAAGGLVCLADGAEPGFNKTEPIFPNYVAAGMAVGTAATSGWFTEGGQGG